MLNMLRSAKPSIEREATLDPVIRDTANDFSDLGLDLCEVKGQVLGARDGVDSLRTSFEEMMGDANDTLSLSTQVRSTAEDMANTLNGSQDASRVADQAFSDANTRINTLIETVSQISDQMSDFQSALGEVLTATRTISEIAGKTSMLSINAAVEAARAGEAGKGFAIVAGQVKMLAERSSDAASRIDTSLKSLNGKSQELIGACGSASKEADGVRSHTGELGDSLATLTDAFESLASAANRTSSAVAEIDTSCAGLVENIRDNHVLVSGVSTQLDEAAKATTALNTRADGLVARMASNTPDLTDTKFINLATATAAEISTLFEQEVDAGRISMDALFDYSYEPIAGTDPVQYLTPYTTLHERVVQSIIDSIRDSDHRVVFCSASDPNGYLSVNNTVWSKPQGDDPVWNAANSRNRRILDDPVSRASGSVKQSFLLQTYRRDMGGGRFDPMKDVSAPIVVKGKHWGGFRVAYNPRASAR